MSSVEDRLAALEQEMADIRRQVKRPDSWIERIDGSMKDFPEFDEVVRLGQQIRSEQAGTADET